MLTYAAGKCKDVATCSTYRTSFVSQVSTGTGKVSLTAGYALETAQVVAACSEDTCFKLLVYAAFSY